MFQKQQHLAISGAVDEATYESVHQKGSYLGTAPVNDIGTRRAPIVDNEED